MADEFQTVAPKIAQEWFKNGEAIIIDVREPAEYSAEHIEGAVNHPVDTIDSEKLAKEFSGKKIIFHCASGKRASNACVACEGRIEDVYVLEGSLPGWKQAGLAVKGNGKLSLERQVLLTAGSLVLFFILIDAEIISAAVGAGMMFAGYTGNCMLKQLLMKLPYNQTA